MIQSGNIYTKRLRSCGKKPALATIPSGVRLLDFVDPELPAELGLDVDEVNHSVNNETGESRYIYLIKSSKTVAIYFIWLWKSSILKPLI